MSMQTLTWDVDAAAVAGNSDAYIVSHLLRRWDKTRGYSTNQCLQGYVWVCVCMQELLNSSPNVIWYFQLGVYFDYLQLYSNTVEPRYNEVGYNKILL